MYDKLIIDYVCNVYVLRISLFKSFYVQVNHFNCFKKVCSSIFNVLITEFKKIPRVY